MEKHPCKGEPITLSGWPGGTSGLRVDAESRRRVFLPHRGVLHRVEVVLPGYDVQPCCEIRRTFWAKCPEFRSAEIGRWMEKRGDKPWPNGNPPKYAAEFVMGSNGFAVVRVLQ